MALWQSVISVVLHASLIILTLTILITFGHHHYCAPEKNMDVKGGDGVDVGERVQPAGHQRWKDPLQAQGSES